MVRAWLAVGIAGLASVFGAPQWAEARQSPVIVEVVANDGSVFRQIPVHARDAERAYLEAEKGARYRIRVQNTTGERLGLVIAVDGRNIINGARSELDRGEPMYVLDGWHTEDYSGWRANLDAINEFYFTDWQDSYAEAFGDRSARGVISVAVYREVDRPRPRPRLYSRESEDAEPAPPAASEAPVLADRADKAEQSAGAGAKRAPSSSAGTGYGDRRTDRAVEVEFMAESAVASRHFLKYEWRETLCAKRVLECGESNRFWNEPALGFAPPPPRKR
jgi:hypothetical protein